MKVLVLGSNTRLGRMIASSWPEYDVAGLDEQHFVATRPQEIYHVLVTYKPNVVINCIERSDRRWCEDHPEQAHVVNSTAVGYLARACEGSRIIFIQMSSSVVERPAQDTYAKSKADGERQAREYCHRLYIVRAPSETNVESDDLKTSLYAKQLLDRHADYGTYTVGDQTTE